MQNAACFTDNRGIRFFLDIRQKDVLMVKNLVVGADGKPLDLLDMADSGSLHMLYGRAQLMLDIVFILCLDQIKEHFDDDEFLRTHEVELETMQGLKSSKLKRLAVWFSEGIGPKQIETLTEAFLAAIVNFTPNPYQREALRKVFENQQTLEKTQAERALILADAKMEKINQELAEKHRLDLIGEPF